MLKKSLQQDNKVFSFKKGCDIQDESQIRKKPNPLELPLQVNLQILENIQSYRGL